VLEGEAFLVFAGEDIAVRVAPDRPGLIAPQATHHVEITGPVRLFVEFYDEPPVLDPPAECA
jgi:hypothetical protein